MDGWNTEARPIFRGYVSIRECNILRDTTPINKSNLSRHEPHLMHLAHRQKVLHDATDCRCCLGQPAQQITQSSCFTEILDLVFQVPFDPLAQV